MSGASGGIRKGCSIDGPDRALSARVEGHTDADSLLGGIGCPERWSLVPRLRPVPRQHLGTRNANGDLAKHTLTVLYSLVLSWYCSLSTHSG